MSARRYRRLNRYSNSARQRGAQFASERVVAGAQCLIQTAEHRRISLRVLRWQLLSWSQLRHTKPAGQRILNSTSRHLSPLPYCFMNSFRLMPFWNWTRLRLMTNSIFNQLLVMTLCHNAKRTHKLVAISQNFKI